MARLAAFVDTTVEKPDDELKMGESDKKGNTRQTFRTYYCSQTSQSMTPHRANRERYIPYLHPHHKRVAFYPCHTNISPNQSRSKECIHRRDICPDRHDFDKTEASRTFGRKTDWQEARLSHRSSD